MARADLVRWIAQHESDVFEEAWYPSPKWITQAERWAWKVENWMRLPWWKRALMNWRTFKK